MTELVITGAFFLIRKNFISLVYLFEILFGFGITGMKVRVVLFSCFSICFFKVIVAY